MTLVCHTWFSYQALVNGEWRRGGFLQPSLIALMSKKPCFAPGIHVFVTSMTESVVPDGSICFWGNVSCCILYKVMTLPNWAQSLPLHHAILYFVYLHPCIVVDDILRSIILTLGSKIILRRNLKYSMSTFFFTLIEKVKAYRLL